MILHVQGLRGIAIIAVLLFHLWPLNFPNGYIGVDMFFVLSGYLMAMIFSKHEKISFQIITEFYYKRVKRIFPLYYLLIPSIFIAGQIFLNHAWIPMNNRHALYSMVLLKNMETIWDGSDYFQGFQTAAPSRDLFLHTWSLAVEIQFYLFVPFIFLALTHFPKFLYKMVILSGISVIACAQYYYSNPIFSFNYPLSRLWQFCSGMMAFLIYQHFEQREINLDCKETKEVKKSASCSITETTKKMLADWSILLAIILLWPISINNAFLRPLFTAITAILLVLQSGMTSKILQHSWLTKIGDGSYTLYLVHWPVIVLFKRDTVTSYQLCIGLIIFISIALFMFYEEFYRKFSVTTISILLVFLFLFNAGIYCATNYSSTVRQVFQDIRLSKLDPPTRAAVDKNYFFAGIPVQGIAKCLYNRSASEGVRAFEYPWGVCDYENGHGDKKVLVIGNSYAMNQGNVINEEFKGNYSTFRLITNKGLQVLYDHFENSTDSLYYGQHERAMKMAEEYAPDVMFIATRFQDIQKLKLQVKNAKDDSLVYHYNKQIRRLEATGAKVFIQGSTPYFPLLHANVLIEALIEGSDIEQFHLNKEKADEEMLPGEQRLAAVACRNCETYDTKSSFLDKDRYLGFDPDTRLSFFDNSIHFTAAGLERLRPVYRRIIESL